MSSRITIGLAVLFLFGAVVAGYWGLVLSRAPDPTPQAPVVQAPTPAVPVTTRRATQTATSKLLLPGSLPIDPTGGRYLYSDLPICSA